MPFIRKRSDLVLSEEDKNYLLELCRLRTQPHAIVKRARILLAFSEGMPISRIGKEENRDRPVVERYIDKALFGGIQTALKDLKHSGRPPVITDEDTI